MAYIVRGHGPLPPPKKKNIHGPSPSCWEGPIFLFRVRGERPKSEAQEADSRGEVLEEGAAGPSPPVTGPEGALYAPPSRSGAGAF